MSTATIELVNNAAAVAVQQKQQDVAISSNGGGAAGALTTARAFASGLLERVLAALLTNLSLKKQGAPPC
jgi:hypothetical protein